MSLVLKYIAFAIFSILVNLAMQYISFFVYAGVFDLYVAMFFGTLAGLVVKYVLDKKYIFYHKVESRKDDGIKFILYAFMGIFTTLIFWSFEIGFNVIFGGQYAKYAGAILGLGIGYIIKYQLDKKFVFMK